MPEKYDSLMGALRADSPGASENYYLKQDLRNTKEKLARVNKELKTAKALIRRLKLHLKERGDRPLNP